MIRAQNIAKYYGAHAAVLDISLHVAPGEVVGLLGLNGAGKTTTMGLLSGLVAPTSGEVHIAGFDLSKNPHAARARLGFLPERPPLYLDMTVLGYMHFVAAIHGVPKRERTAHVHDALQSTDLTHVQDVVIGTLSHGYQRRVGIAQTVVHAPQAILLDEPTGGLDPIQVVHMRRLIQRLRGQRAILVSSHVLTEIQALCDRIIVLEGGRVAAQGTEQELAARVQQAAVVHVEVAAPQAAVLAALKGLAGMSDLQVIRAAPEMTRLKLRLDLDNRAEIARRLVHANLALTEMAPARAALEQTFLALMGESPGSLANGQEHT